MLNERKKKVTGYEDQGYKMKINLRDCIANAFQDLKQDENSSTGWNILYDELQGLTMRFLDNDKIEVTYHKIVTGLPDDVTRHEPEGKKFLDYVVSELKKRTKKLTKKVLNLKKVGELNRSVEKYSHMQAQTSWMFQGSLGQAVARYLVRYSCVFEYDKK